MTKQNSICCENMKPTSASYKPCFKATEPGHQSNRALGTSLSLANTQSNHLKRTEKGQSQVTDLQRCTIEAEIELQSR